MPINAPLPLPRHKLFRLRNILLIVMLAIFLLPLGGLYFFRIYENELVRQTELELISQSAVFAATYRQLLRVSQRADDYGYIVHHSSLIPASGKSYLRKKTPTDPFYTPIKPQLDLIKPISGTRPDPRLPEKLTDPLAAQAGKLMTQIMRDSQQVTLSGIRILDMNGVVVAGREEMGMSLAHVKEVKQALRGQYASLIRLRVRDEKPPPLYSISRGTNIRVFVAFPVIENQRLQGVIYMSRTPKHIIKHLYDVQDKIYVAAFILLLIAGLTILFVSATISRPIRELIQQTEKVVKGEQRYIEPLKHPITYEVAQLSDRFSTLSQELAERSDYIRRFATHVSHEFKTPLTSMQGALELLQEHIDDMPAEKRQRFMDNVLADTHRLRNLVNRLLELARADSLETRQESSQLPQLISKLHNRYQERGLQLNSQQLSDTPLAIAPDALEAILSNLFENSLQHGADTVAISTQTHADTLHIRVHDNGSGISDANRDKVFTPFFTTRRNRGGTGLGLEIIVSILRAYGGHIELADSEQGAAFLITLPCIAKF